MTPCTRSTIEYLPTLSGERKQRELFRQHLAQEMLYGALD
jgi:hypothetical protein